MLLLIFPLGFSNIIQTANGITYVEGNITTDTTWAVANSPYRVINDVIVDPGVRLIIESGVEIQLADGFSLIVEGSFEAVGTETNPIIFTSSRVEPMPGAWNTIRFNGDINEEFSLNNAKIEYAQNGITVDNLGLTTIRDNQILNCSQNGILIEGNNHVIIEDNSLRLNLNGIQVGIDEFSGTLQIDGNLISDNFEYGFNGDINHNFSRLDFTNNVILENGRDGVYLHSYYWIYDLTFSSNNISLNGDTGIYVDSEYEDIYDVSISSNTILSNGEYGVNLDAQDYVYDFSFLGNTISSNNDDGIRIHAGYRVFEGSFSSNSISSNSDGIQIYGGSATYNISFYSN
jgi:hypothetical protein